MLGKHKQQFVIGVCQKAPGYPCKSLLELFVRISAGAWPMPNGFVVAFCRRNIGYQDGYQCLVVRPSECGDIQHIYRVVDQL